jgi:polyhydroxyalkanoate synthesis repressor PhaR
MKAKKSSAPGSRRIELRRYPNRRYYDRTRSQHLTLEQIYRLVREGYEVTIVDSKTDEDITAKVLAHIILEHDPPKLVAFPVELLHEIIRSNESLLREFVEKYFSRALAAFLRSQEEFDRYLGQMLGLSGAPSLGRDWARMMMGPFVRAFAPNGKDNAEADQEFAEERPDHDAGLRETVEELKQQIAALRQELGRR